MRVLVVERDEDLRTLLEAVLGADHSVTGVDCGRGALRELHACPPDVMLVDLTICGVSGEELARAAAGLARAPRVVLMSADHKRLERSASLAHAFLPKPFPLRDLAGAIGTSY